MPGIDEYTKLMLHLDNNVLDSSLLPKTVTNSGITFSPNGKFDACGQFSNSGYLSTPPSADFAFSGDFTVDFWVNSTNWKSTWEPVVVGEATGAIWIGVGDDGRFGLRGYSQSAYVSSSVPPQGQWVHIAISRNGSTAYLFYNGVLQASGDCRNDFAQGKLYIGSDGSTNRFAGLLDEIRISKGVARWTQNFVPPNAPYSENLAAPLLSAPLAAPENSSVLVSWTSVEDAQSYELQANGVNVYSGASTSYQGQIQSSSVTWRVRAVNEETQSDWSSEKTTVVLPNLQNVILGGE